MIKLTTKDQLKYNFKEPTYTKEQIRILMEMRIYSRRHAAMEAFEKHGIEDYPTAFKRGYLGAITDLLDMLK